MMKRTSQGAVAVLLFLGAAALAAAGGTSEGSPAASGGGAGELLGAGSSFAFPIYSKMGEAYNAATGAKINYQSIGSSGGIKNVMNKVVDFGASDAYLTDEQLTQFTAPVVQFPTVAGAIVVTYNLPGNPVLRLTGETVAKIFLGAITRWNDPEIAATNPGVTLPDRAIVVAHRSDGSGTTFNFTLYLSRVSSEWQSRVGNSTSVSWPVGLGGAQNAGVAGIVKQTPGAVGYVELAYATQNGLPYATLRNKAGNWIVPSLESTSAAADTQIPADGRIYLADTDAPKGYPIATLTWLIAYREQGYDGRSREQAKRLVDWFTFVTHSGQQYAASLDYAKLPPAAVSVDERIIQSITYGGKSLAD